MSLRLLIDYALGKKKKLYITFVDFRKAYDLVPRYALLRTLAKMGCGYAMVLTIAAMYGDTKLILGAATILATIGVRQGSPSSCFLFVLYINKLVEDLRSLCPSDGFLKWIHALLLMDDTVLLSTTREGSLKKLEILINFCAQSGMEINEKKTEFMVINGDEIDKQDMVVQNLRVKNCQKYTYLGVIFNQDGKLTTAVKDHVLSKQPQLLKFAAFVRKNTDAPFWVKKKVLESALLSSVLYGAEAWVSNSGIKQANSLYLAMLKVLLGVRPSAPTNLVLSEIDVPSLSARVKSAQKNFLEKLLKSREKMDDDPFIAIWQMCKQEKSKAFKFLSKVLTEERLFETDREERWINIQQATGSKFVVYREMNPDLSVHEMYTNKNISEFDRLVATRIRLSSHELAIEKGRWSRTPRESRLCNCGEIQTEVHVVCFCPITDVVRASYPELNFQSLEAVFKSVDSTKAIRAIRRCYELVIK